MKTTKYFIFLWLLGITLISNAQNFDPGMQAQGYLEKNNSAVNLMTGMFSYTIPLFNLTAGDFTLPLSINYSQRKFTLNDADGILGYSWSLQTGGIVTRVIRGGIADEVPEKGYVYNAQLEKLNETEIARTNSHERDGESDIFTAVFNGQTLNFIILEEDGNIVVKPLEKTNVKIECSYNGKYITSWNIIDENGITYVFSVLEWTENITKDAESSLGNIENQSYVSSWYISSINLPNSKGIKFSYDTRKSQTFNSTKNYSTDYVYGQPMKYFKFDFKSHQSDFDNSLRDAIKAFETTALRMNGNDVLNYGIEKNMPLMGFGLTKMDMFIESENTIRTIMGVSATSNSEYPVLEVCRKLNDMIKYYQRYPTIVNYLQKALWHLRFCFGTE